MRFPEFTGEWKLVPFISNLAKLENGANYDTNDTDGVPMSRIETISTGQIDYRKVGYCSTPHKVERYKMQYGDILFSHINSIKHIGKTAYYSLDKPLYHGMNLLLIRCNNNVDSKFFFYLINNIRFLRHCRILAKQAVNQASISTSDLKKLIVSIPDKSEQAKIQNLLSLIDERIATQNKIIEKYESLIKAISKTLLGESDQYMYLGELCEIKKGVQVNKEKLSEKGLYYVMNGGITPSGYYDLYNTEANTISISEGGNSCGYVQCNYTPFWSGGHCYTLENISDIIDNRYLFHYLKANELQIMSLRIGSGLPNIQKKDLSAFRIPLPALNKQKNVAKALDSLLYKTEVEKDIYSIYRQQKVYFLDNLFI